VELTEAQNVQPLHDTAKVQVTKHTMVEVSNYFMGGLLSVCANGRKLVAGMNIFFLRQLERRDLLVMKHRR
jgi:hypothetical protein